jgi:chemotaxis response regulator CheB
VAEEASFDLIALVASAGGLEALTVALRDLPEDLPVAVVVSQHLGGKGSLLVDILRRRIALPVSWAEEGAPLKPGEVVVCPPRRVLEVLPDRTVILPPLSQTHNGRPLDQMLGSVASSYGDRAVVVILTGMGKDASLGARAVREAGGTVIAQSQPSAEHPEMPGAAVAVGAVDLILPLAEIGAVLHDLVRGGELPRSPEERASVERLFSGGDEVSALYRSMDWRNTSLGPVIGWPQELSAVATTAGRAECRRCRDFWC